MPLQHTFEAAGVYAVTITLTDDDGGEEKAAFNVVVSPAWYRMSLPIMLKS